MTMTLTKAAAVALAACVLTTGGASAQEHRRDQVRDRIEDSDNRINREYRHGNISRGEARKLKQENREIAHDAWRQSHDGNGLSHHEQRGINEDQNRLNRQITRESR